MSVSLVQELQRGKKLSITPEQVARILTEEVEGVIGLQARRLCRAYGFTRADIEEVEQELRLHLCQNEDRFDPTIGDRGAWASSVLTRKCASLFRYRRAAKRYAGRPDVSIEDSDAGSHAAPHAGPADLRIDLAALRSELAGDERDVMDALIECGSDSAAAIRLGRPRAFVAKVRASLRAKCTDAGLAIYL